MSEETGSRYVMLIDLDSCSGCHACSVACKAEHRAPLGQFRTRVQTVLSGSFPAVRQRFVPTLCQHCVDAPCLKVCPTEAIVRTEEGIVQVDADRCAGTGVCVPSCPYGAIFLDKRDGIAQKCDFCEDRLTDGEEPACVATCPTDALHFGPTDRADIAQWLADGKYADQWERENTQPRVWYRGLDQETKEKLRPIDQVPTGLSCD